ncbi:MAG: putative dual-specificity RNA methyltransferase RlmN [Candidatus Peregrinibacteria bacterium GW2011_GWA2_47_7]|nr:MAG: putative dual-specificity RNA methyltransferase RlmN [Candidatus Peregrinibacteria bacterium GW2011_GWA2_47_7]
MISFGDMTEAFKAKKIPSYRVKQIFHAIYKEGVSDYRAIKILPEDLREMLAKDFPIFPFSVTREVISKNGVTVKTLFKLSDGNLVEGVLMRFADGRNSVCVSSQVGCGLKCAFCATGTMGLTRSLTASEIADQVLYFDQYLKKYKSRVSHVIFMGMGEPLLNYDNVLAAVRTLNDPQCLEIAIRHITISTSGIIPSIEKLADEPLQVNLALSIHAPNQELRSKLMPIAKAYKLPDLIAAIELYIAKTHRRISYEYVMLKNINDTPELARELAVLIKGQRCHVNLIPYNETYLGFSNAGKSRIDNFKKVLESFEIPVTVRVSLGKDINAACGQLATKEPR